MYFRKIREITTFEIDVDLYQIKSIIKNLHGYKLSAFLATVTFKEGNMSCNLLWYFSGGPTVST